MPKPLVFAVVGLQNTGKTRLVQRLLQHYHRLGLHCAVVKHDGHAVAEQVPAWQKPGSDTQVFAEAGAQYTLLGGGGQTLLFSAASKDTEDVQWLIQRVQQQAELDGMDLDVIIAEGFKDSLLPKVAVVRTQEQLHWLRGQRLVDLHAVVAPQELVAAVREIPLDVDKVEGKVRDGAAAIAADSAADSAAASASDSAEDGADDSAKDRAHHKTRGSVTVLSDEDMAAVCDFLLRRETWEN